MTQLQEIILSVLMVALVVWIILNMGIDVYKRITNIKKIGNGRGNNV